ncbi:DUF2818 family protein [Castellaniella defragrans]|uniref:DUF2818 family protein n=1 Tax=Castellaniella defragrans TaxID=75697 RepID=A0A7W9TPR1_CASDE|nr:hypothetical protein [Castellaniella defragrans]
MSLTAAVWIVILCALVMANLPFLLERRLAPWPWAPDGALSGLARWGLGLAFLAGMALWCWGTLKLVGGTFAGGGATAGLFFLKLLASLLAAGLLLALPGWRRPAAGASADTAAGAAAARHSGVRPHGAGAKSFFDRLLEVLVGYVLVGTLGFALELNLGNAFPQRWEFYAVTLALFLVLGYPGFVWRYMLRRRHA